MTWGSLRWAAWLEALGVALSPAVAALVLRLRLMAPSVLPDPGIYTSSIVDPGQVFTRYAAVYAGTGRAARDRGGSVSWYRPGCPICPSVQCLASLSSGMCSRWWQWALFTCCCAASTVLPLGWLASWRCFRRR